MDKDSNERRNGPATFILACVLTVKTHLFFSWKSAIVGLKEKTECTRGCFRIVPLLAIIIMCVNCVATANLLKCFLLF